MFILDKVFMLTRFTFKILKEHGIIADRNRLVGIMLLCDVLR